MSKTQSTLIAFAICAGVAAPAFAQEQEEGVVELSGDTSAQTTTSTESSAAPGAARGPLSVYAGFRLGVGGKWKLKPDGGGADTTDDLKATPGLQFGADYVIWDYIAVGGELRLGWFNTDTRDDADIGRDTFVDIVVKPRGRYAFSNIPLEVYGMMPLGITFIHTNGDLEDKTNADYSQGPAFNLGIGGGASYFFTDHWGVNAEMAYYMYWFGSDIEAAGVKASASNFVGQFQLFSVNAVYTL
jgi:hypothetical protein